MGAGAAIVTCRAGRRDGSRQSFGKQHHDRQERDTPVAHAIAIAALPRGLSLFRGREGRIDDRSRLGRRRRRSPRMASILAESARFCRSCAIRRSPTSISISSRRSACGKARSTTTAAMPASRPEDFRQISFRLAPPAGDVGLQRDVARFPFVPADPARLAQDCYEAYNIQVSGAGAAACRNEDRQARHRRFRRPRFDARADRRGQSDGSARQAAQQYSRLYDAGLRHERDDEGQCLRADEGAWRHRKELDITETARLMLTEIGHPYSSGRRRSMT